MEKEPQPDSMATVTIKPDYPPSEVYSTEPPPAYHRSQSSAVQVAKIVAITVVLMSVILGSFLLASAYVTANASCRQLEQELELLGEAADRFQAPLQPEALVQEPPHRLKQHIEPLQEEESVKNVKEVDNNNIESDSETSDNNYSDSSSDSSSSEEEEKPVHFKLPLQLDFDDLAGALIEKNKKSRMNCVVEKKHAEEVIDHQPKTIRLPFGLNLTTDPKYERVTGERLAIFCESGDVQKPSPPEDEDDEETIMIQPIMIPIPQTHFPTHMAQEVRPMPHQFHPMENSRPPIRPAPQQVQQSQLPPNSVLHHIAQQIIAQKIMEARQAQEQQQQQQQQHQQQQDRQPNVEYVHPMPEDQMPQRIPVPEELLTQLNRLPNHDVIVTVQRQEPEEIQPESQEVHVDQEMRIIPVEMKMVPQEMRPVQQEVNTAPQMMHPVVQEMRHMPQQVRVFQQAMRGPPTEMHAAEQQRENPQEQNDKQTFAREIPVHIPVHMQDSRVSAPEESRVHYVQPRSVRSVDALLAKSQKRVKRCSCDCAC